MTPPLLELTNLPLLSFALQLLRTLGTVLNSSPMYATLPENPNGGFVYGSFQNRTVCFSAHSFEEPRSLQELRHIVQDALQNHLTVKAVGSLHTATDMICTEGVPISMKGINFIEVNDDDSVTVGAGAQVTDILEELHKYGKSLIHVPTFGGITVGGAMGSGSHGSSLLHGTISDEVVALKIVDGTGNVRFLSDPVQLRAFRAHLGLLGIIYSVTLRTVPLFKMRLHNYPDTEEMLFNGKLLKMAREHDFFQVFWFPSDHSIVVSQGDFISLRSPGNASTNFIPEIDESIVTLFRNIVEKQQDLSDLRGMRILQTLSQVSLYGYSPRKQLIFTEDGKTLKNPAVGYGHRLMANRCKHEKCPWKVYPEESGLAMEVNQFTKVIYTVKSILKESPAEFPLLGFFFRFSKASDGLLTIESGRETLHMDWVESSRFDPFKTARAGLGAHQAIMQALIDRHDARVHWGKNGMHYFTQHYLTKRENLWIFRDFMKHFDPFGVFLNDFGRRILGISDHFSWDPREKHCALRDNCICQDDYDCGNTNDVKCIQVLGYNVCQKSAKTALIKFLNTDPSYNYWYKQNEI